VRLLPAVALAAAAAAAGCGGDDDGALSAAEYRKQGNALCFQIEFNKLNPELKKGEKLTRRLRLDECLRTGAPSRQPDDS